MKDVLDGDETENDIKNLKAIMQGISLLDPNLNIQVFNSPFDVPKQILNIKMGKKLGKGGQGTAYKCTLEGFRDIEYVDKIVKTKDSADNQHSVKLWRMYAEFCIGKDLQHPNLAKYHYFMRQYNPAKKEHVFHIILELINGGDMEEKINNLGSTKNIETIQEIGGQLISGLRYLHERKIIHQDFKPSNILIDDEFKTAKIIDLGVSKRMESSVKIGEDTKGTIRYMAPEQFLGHSNFRIDIWAFGCVLF